MLISYRIRTEISLPVICISMKNLRCLDTDLFGLGDDTTKEEINNNAFTRLYVTVRVCGDSRSEEDRKSGADRINDMIQSTAQSTPSTDVLLEMAFQHKLYFACNPNEPTDFLFELRRDICLSDNIIATCSQTFDNVPFLNGVLKFCHESVPSVAELEVNMR